MQLCVMQLCKWRSPAQDADSEVARVSRLLPDGGGILIKPVEVQTRMLFQKLCMELPRNERERNDRILYAIVYCVEGNTRQPLFLLVPRARQLDRMHASLTCEGTQDERLIFLRAPAI